MKRINRIVLAIAVALVAVSGLGAATWVWSTPYDNVTGYRYQIGSESEDGWTYVGSDVTSLTLDSREETTVYVQLTVDDGRFWSPSGVATYVPQAVPTVENLTNQDQNVVEGLVVPASEVPAINDIPVEEEVVEAVPVVEGEMAVTDEAVIENSVAAVDEAVDEELPAEESFEDETVAEFDVVDEELPAEEPFEDETVAVIGGADEPTDIVVTDEELPEDEIFEEEIPADDEDSMEAEPDGKKGKDFRFGMDISVVSEIGMRTRTVSFQPVLGFNFKNVASPADWFGLDIDLNLVGLFTPDASLNGGAINYFKNLLSNKLAMGGAVELAARPAFSFSGCEIGVLLGGGANIYAGPTATGRKAPDLPSLFKNDAVLVNAYALAGIDFSYNFSDTFNMGVGYKFKYTFDSVPADSVMSNSVLVSMGFTF